MEQEETDKEKIVRYRRGKLREFEERIKSIEKRQSALLESFEEFRRKYD